MLSTTFNYNCKKLHILVWQHQRSVFTVDMFAIFAIGNYKACYLYLLNTQMLNTMLKSLPVNNFSLFQFFFFVCVSECSSNVL